MVSNSNNELVLFTDEESQHNYHKAPLLLQVVCQVFETHAASFGVQTELIDCDKTGGLWIAAIATTEVLEGEAAEQLVRITNHSFKRRDNVTTCSLESSEVGLYSLRVSDSSDYSQMN